jgi:hypothetical protein
MVRLEGVKPKKQRGTVISAVESAALTKAKCHVSRNDLHVVAWKRENVADILHTKKGRGIYPIVYFHFKDAISANHNLSSTQGCQTRGTTSHLLCKEAHAHECNP